MLFSAAFVLVLFRVNYVSGQFDCRDVADYVHCYTAYITGQCYGAGQARMLRLCRMSCGLCHIPLPTPPPSAQKCEDKNKLCPRWKRYCNEDSRYFSYMKRHCRKTCQFCSPCEDTHKSCKYYENNGYCWQGSRYHSFMKKRCALTCGFCSLNGTAPTKKPVALKRTFECYFEKDECDWWNQFVADNADWIVGIDRNGPARGQGGNGTYLYLNTLYRNFKGVLWLPWELILPDHMMKTKTTAMCFHFHYFLGAGILTVAQGQTPSSMDKNPIERSLIERTVETSDWTKAAVNVNVGHQFYLHVTGINKGHESIALDSFYFTKGKCR